MADIHGLQPGSAPSATVALVRWDAELVDALVLCDCVVVALARDRAVREVRDSRFAETTAAVQRPIAVADDLKAWRRVVAEEAKFRNQPGGFWVAEAIPEAAREAVTVQWPIEELSVVLVMSDGVSAGVDRYGVPPDWASALALAADSPARLIDVIHEAEAEDPSCQRWPRSKPHDDKALAVIRFDQMRGRASL